MSYGECSVKMVKCYSARLDWTLCLLQVAEGPAHHYHRENSKKCHNISYQNYCVTRPMNSIVWQNMAISCSQCGANCQIRSVCQGLRNGVVLAAITFLFTFTLILYRTICFPLGQINRNLYLSYWTCV